jgi:hypothetical protein
MFYKIKKHKLYDRKYKSFGFKSSISEKWTIEILKSNIQIFNKLDQKE